MSSTRTGHGFSDEPATRKMHAEFAAADIDRRHVLADLPDRAEDVAELVLAARERGRCRMRVSRLQRCEVELGRAAAVLCGTTQVQLADLCTPQEEVQVVLPRVADAAEELQAVLEHPLLALAR